MTSNRLPVLVHEINEHDTARRACEVKGLMHGLRIGQLLIEAKRLVPHGGFLDWLKANTKVTPRMCQIYMRLARSEKIRWMVEREYETVSHLTITKAVELERRSEKQWALAINKPWDKARESQRKLASSLVEVRKHFDDEDGFISSIVTQMGLPQSFAEKVPALIAVEYDADAWTAVILDSLAEADAEKAP